MHNKLLADRSTNSDASYKYQIAFVKSLPPAAAADAVQAVIATALRLPNVFDFDTLFRLDALTAAKGTPLFALLQIFVNGGLAEYKAWEESHAGVAEQHSEWYSTSDTDRCIEDIAKIWTRRS